MLELNRNARGVLSITINKSKFIHVLHEANYIFFIATIRGRQSPQEAVETLLPATMAPSTFPSIPPPTVLVPLASHAVQVLTEEVQRDQGVSSNTKFQPQTARDKMRLMFQQNEAQRQQNEEKKKK
jgi:hypothetical protein